MATPENSSCSRPKLRLFIIVFNVIATFIILKVISFITPLRMDEATLKVGDDAIHGETAYAIRSGND